MAPQTKKRKVINPVETKINKIGDDCAKHIFEYLTDFDAFSLMLTCEQFRDGIELMDELVLGEKLTTKDMADECVFCELELDEDLYEDIRNMLKGWLDSKYCRNYKSINISGRIGVKEARDIMEKCPELRQLSIKVSKGKLTIPSLKLLEKLEILGSATLQFNTELPSVKSLSIFSALHSCQDIVKYFPNLEELLLTFQGSDLTPLKSLKNLISLHIITHPRSSLKTDQLYESMGIPNLETFKLDLNGPFSLCNPIIRNKITCPVLKTLHISNRNYLDEDLELVDEDEDIDSLILQFCQSNFPKLEHLKVEFASNQVNLLLKGEYLTKLKTLSLKNITKESLKEICGNSSLSGLEDLDFSIDVEGEDDDGDGDSSVFKYLSESIFENLKSLSITLEGGSTDKAFRDFCESEKFTQLEHLRINCHIQPKSILPKSKAFPNLKSLYILFLEGKSSFLNELAKNESFGKLEEFVVGSFVSMSDLQKLKKSTCLKRLTRVRSEDNEDDE